MSKYSNLVEEIDKREGQGTKANLDNELSFLSKPPATCTIAYKS